MPKRGAIAFTGPSGSGKTTLIEKIAKILVENQKVAIIKHDPKDKAQFDTKGKDSHRFSATGAEVVVVSPHKTTYLSKKEKNLTQIVNMIDDFDILLVEGLKTLPLPRIAIFRNTIEESYLNCCEAVAIDDSIDIKDYTIPSDIALLDLNNTQQIIEWIKIHAQEI